MTQENHESESAPTTPQREQVGSTALLALGFKLGFMVSREGFNGECNFDHCGPMKVEAHYQEVEEFMEAVEESEQFRELRDEAISLCANDQEQERAKRCRSAPTCSRNFLNYE